MATCRYCGRGGLFRSVDGNGLCADCRRPVALAVSSANRVLTDSLKLAQTGKTLSTRLGRWDLAIEKAEALLEYERKGIPTISPPPSEVLTFAQANRLMAVNEGLEGELQAAESKADLAATPAARLNAFAHAVQAIEDMKRRYKDDTILSAGLDVLERRARARHSEVRLENMLDVARRAQFKGQKAKAIDGYKDVLYELEKDTATDHSAEIASLESLIAELSSG